MVKIIDLTEFSEKQKKLVKDFLNNASSTDIELLFINNPAFTTGSGNSENYTIGTSVAKEIDVLKNDLGGTIASLESLASIRGFGQDKLRDLVYTVSANFEEYYSKGAGI